MNEINKYLVHHGILGQKWGRRNGPPYPLNPVTRSSEEKRKNGSKYTESGLAAYKNASLGFKNGVKVIKGGASGSSTKGASSGSSSSLGNKAPEGWIKQYRLDMDEKLASNPNFTFDSEEAFRSYLQSSGVDVSSLSDSTIAGMYKTAQAALTAYKSLNKSDSKSGSSGKGSSGGSGKGSGKGSSKGESEKSEETEKSDEPTYDTIDSKEWKSKKNDIVKSFLDKSEDYKPPSSKNEMVQMLKNFGLYDDSDAKKPSLSGDQIIDLWNEIAAITKTENETITNALDVVYDDLPRVVKLNPDFELEDIDETKLYLSELGVDEKFGYDELERMMKKINSKAKRIESVEEVEHSEELNHHGILGQKWGRRNGPPYPLNPANRSSDEKRKNGSKYTESGLNSYANAKLALGGGGGGGSNDDEDEEDWLKKLKEDIAKNANLKFSDLSEFSSYLKGLGVKAEDYTKTQLATMYAKARATITQKNFGDKIRNAIGDAKSTANNLGSKAKSTYNDAKSKVENTYNTGRGVANKAISDTKKKASEVVSDAKSAYDTGRGVANKVVSDTKSKASKVVSDAKDIYDTGRGVANKAISDTKKKASKVVSDAKDIYDTGRGVANKAISDTKSKASKVVSDAKDIYDTGRGVANKAISDTKKKASEVVSDAKDIYDTGRGVANKAITDTKKKASEVVSDAKSAYDTGRGVVNKAISDTKSKASEVVSDAKSAYDVGRGVANKAISDTKSKASKVVSDAKDIYDTGRGVANKAISDTKKKASEVVSDAKDIYDTGRGVANKAITDTKKKASEVVSDIEEAVSKANTLRVPIRQRNYLNGKLVSDNYVTAEVKISDIIKESPKLASFYGEAYAKYGAKKANEFIEENVSKIVDFYNNNKDVSKIADKLGLSKSDISEINKYLEKLTHSENYKDALMHHGILGMRWGKRNGPPYPLERSRGWSAAERRQNKLDRLRYKTEKAEAKARLYEAKTKRAGAKAEMRMAKTDAIVAQREKIASIFSRNIRRAQNYSRNNEYSVLGKQTLIDKQKSSNQSNNNQQVSNVGAGREFVNNLVKELNPIVSLGTNTMNMVGTYDRLKKQLSDNKTTTSNSGLNNSSDLSSAFLSFSKDYNNLRNENPSIDAILDSSFDEIWNEVYK